MKTNLQFDFIVNKENNTVNVKREFAAQLPLVWDCWTKQEILDLWWAPKPYKTETKSMDFREGGTWHYGMVAPDGMIHWCRNDYKKINPQESFSALDAFCDENGVVNTDFPRTTWNNTFIDNGATTTVNIVAQYERLADLEQIIAMGFQEGFTMALGNLDEYLNVMTK
ncbi:MAG TPA: SRPBCC domain-containing protein [Flavobacterium sp.]|nr:SRPBCC domain-containing protein [Flavobacterium sp.]